MKRKNYGMILLALLAAAFIGYFVLYISLVDATNKFTWFWLLAGIAILGWDGILVWMNVHGQHFPVWFRNTVMTVCGLGLLLFVIIEGIIIGNGRSMPDTGADYVIVLGARVRGVKPSYNLKKRLEKAYDYLKQNPDTRVVLSGGRGPGEDISEAEAMRNYLTERGIDDDRMLLEDASVNTDQNLEYSMKKLSSKNAKVVIVSNQFHIYRALRIARKKGLSQVQGLGSAVKWYTAPNMYVREAFAVLKYVLCRQI